GFDGELRPYQERGVAWLSFLGRLGLGCVLADDMGLGKTAETLCLVMNDVETRSPAPGQAARPAPTLVVCPMSVVGNWQREAARFALTGTPVENRLSDLWSIMEFTSPGLLGPAEKFRQRYEIPIERAADEEATVRLRRITGPFILRRLKTDKSIISDLPDKLE